MPNYGRGKDVPIWNFFEKSGDGNKTAICKCCRRLLSYKSTITNLKAHLKQKHISEYKILLKLGSNHKATKNVIKNDTTDPIAVETDMTAEYLLEDSDGQSDEGKLTEDDDKKEELFHETKDDIFNESIKSFEEFESEDTTDSEIQKIKRRKETKKRKISIKEYKTRASVMLQKERALQKREKLRLRAIELKLKGEELRLKEIEMNKVTYLANIEEEKLKCFRELSASFKKFLERTNLAT